MEFFFEKLSKFSILDIYDEIAKIPVTDDQVISFCTKYPCRVDLRRGNLLYPVTQKYKERLSKYKNTKALKWLTISLPRLIPNPEARYLRWQELHQRNAKIEWLHRKVDAVSPLPPLCSGSSDSEESLESERRLSAISHSDIGTNSTVGIAQASQLEIKEEKLIQEFADIMFASISSIASEQLPSLFSGTHSSDGLPQEKMDSPKKKNNRERVQSSQTSTSPKRRRLHRKNVKIFLPKVKFG